MRILALRQPQETPPAISNQESNLTAAAAAPPSLRSQRHRCAATATAAPPPPPLHRLCHRCAASDERTPSPTAASSPEQSSSPRRKQPLSLISSSLAAKSSPIQHHIKKRQKQGRAAKPDSGHPSPSQQRKDIRPSFSSGELAVVTVSVPLAGIAIDALRLTAFLLKNVAGTPVIFFLTTGDSGTRCIALHPRSTAPLLLRSRIDLILFEKSPKSLNFIDLTFPPLKSEK
ncbi:hypothetical protein KSP39_PZI005797 [Platanthera zijinensis]|uniref:Uncharacterized protein n=1 Tax=Platanthera zijinensis TaxID=2320716 RepID=A0AAP0GB00_9ASPA